MFAYLRQLIAYDPAAWGKTTILAILRSATEGFSLLLLIPILAIAGITESESGMSGIVGMIRDGMATLAIDPEPVPLLALFLALMLVRAGFNYAYSTRMTLLYTRYVHDLRTDLYRRLSYANWGYLSSHALSRYAHALTSQASELGEGMWRTQGLVSSLITGAVGLAISLAISIELTLLAILVAAVLGLAVIPFDRRVKKLSAQHNEEMGQLYEKFSHHIDGLKVAKSFNAEEAHTADYTAASRTYADTSNAIMRTNNASMILHRLAAALALVVVAWYFLQGDNGIELEPVLLVIIFARLVPHARTVQQNILQIHTILPIHDAFSTLQRDSVAASEQNAIAETDPLSLTAELQVQGLGFRYAGRPEHQVLEDISVTIPAGKATAIIGPSGAGKTTLVDILGGLLSPEKGTILIDGHPLTDSNIRAWRGQIGYVPQDTFLTNQSIRENICLGRPDASDDDIWQALAMAELATLVETLPQTLDTTIGDKGTQLSRGEGQRLSLARALLIKPSILILDEATASLNPTGEIAIIETLQQLKGDITIIIVAHRPSSIRWTDHVIVLQDGCVTEQGTFADLSTSHDSFLQRMIAAESD